LNFKGLVESWRVRDDEISHSGRAIAGLLRAKRESLGYSKNFLAQKAGISVQSVSFIEAAVNSPSLSTFLRICAALEVKPHELLGEALGKPAEVA